MLIKSSKLVFGSQRVDKPLILKRWISRKNSQNSRIIPSKNIKQMNET